MLQRYEPKGPYITKQSAFHPRLMNLRLVFALVFAAKKNRLASIQSSSMVLTGRFHNTLIKQHMLLGNPDRVDSTVGFEDNSVRFRLPVRKQGLTREQRRAAEELNAVGGMRSLMSQ